MSKQSTRIWTRLVPFLIIIATIVSIIALTSCSSADDVDAHYLTGIASTQGETNETDEQKAVEELVEKQKEAQSIGEDEVPEAFEKAVAVNKDIIAWLYVPGTNVTVPIAYRDGDGKYYRLHDATGASSPIGASFLSQGNSSDFSDDVSVVYGHTYNDTSELICFAELHFFSCRISSMKAIHSISTLLTARCLNMKWCLPSSERKKTEGKTRTCSKNRVSKPISIIQPMAMKQKES